MNDLVLNLFFFFFGGGVSVSRKYKIGRWSSIYDIFRLLSFFSVAILTRSQAG